MQDRGCKTKIKTTYETVRSRPTPRMQDQDHLSLGRDLILLITIYT